MVSQPQVSRVILDAPPFLDFEAKSHGSTTPWVDFERWPARWVSPPAGAASPFLSVFRLDFSIDSPLKLRFHVSAHERYELFLTPTDNAGNELQLIGRGPARSVEGIRHFESFDVELNSGNYSFVARVSSLGSRGPWAQTEGETGFLFAVQDEALWDTFATGRGNWQTRLLNGISWVSPGEQTGQVMGCGPLEVASGEVISPSWWREGTWQTPAIGAPGNNGFAVYYQNHVPLLRPSPLPAARDALWHDIELIGADQSQNEVPYGESSPETAAQWDAFWNGEPMQIPPHSRRRFWLRSSEYVCAFPKIWGTNGVGARVRLGWAESLRDEKGQARRLAPFEGNSFNGIWDEVRPEREGPWQFMPSWWRCGLFLRLDIETADSPLELHKLELHETRYPFEIKNHWGQVSPELEKVFQKSVRSLQVCAHETYMDCPYYEQLQYIGDTRLQILCSYAIFDDDRLARQAIWLLDAARRNPAGFMPSSAPSNSRQCISTFPLWWLEMLHDFARLRGDLEFVRPYMKSAREIAEGWIERRDANGLVPLPKGWNFLDWVNELGDLPGPFHGAAGWQVAGVVDRLGELEGWFNEPELAARMKRVAREIADANQQYWCEPRGLFADDLGKTRFSQHTNTFALLSGLLGAAQKELIEAALFDKDASEVTKAGIYFSHYVFQAAIQAKRHDWLQQQLQPWIDLDKQGYKTTPENWRDTRSECHAWGAHPLLNFWTAA